MTAVELREISKSYRGADGPLLVLDRITLAIPAGCITTLFGPNGAGKSTLMNIIARLEPWTGGALLPPAVPRFSVALVAQDFRQTLLPWLSAEENILFPLALRRVPRPLRLDRLRAVLTRTTIDIAPFRTHAPQQLSGGQAQLVCILRALLVDPMLLILDEPFSALDYRTKRLLKRDLERIHTQLGLTTIVVSHDLDDALELGDRVVFLSRRPARVIGSLVNDMPRPRDEAAQVSSAFIELKRQALRLVEPVINDERSSYDDDFPAPSA